MIKCKFYHKIKTRSYGYILDLNNFDYKHNYKYNITLLNNDILEKMYSEYRDEIDEQKYNILKDKISNKSCKTYIALSENDEICGFINLAYKDVEDSCINTIVKVADDTVYLFDVYTFKKYRKKGVYWYLLNDLIKMIKDDGYKYVIGNIIEGTTASERIAYKIGAIKYVEYDYYHIGPIKKTYKQYYSGATYGRE